MDHVFDSKWLINELSHLGFSDEVVKYNQSVIQSETLENLLSEYIPGTFTQWVADNVDPHWMAKDLFMAWESLLFPLQKMQCHYMQGHK